MAKVGRPAKYDPKIHPELVTKLAAEGKTIAELANTLGISRRQLYRWQDKYPEFRQAMAKGKEVVDDQVEESLLKLAKGYRYKDGQSERVVTPSIRAIEFWLKNRRPDEWRDKKDVQVGGSLEVTGEPTPLTPEEAELLERILGCDE